MAQVADLQHALVAKDLNTLVISVRREARIEDGNDLIIGALHNNADIVEVAFFFNVFTEAVGAEC